jgi:hypothetical protein
MDPVRIEAAKAVITGKSCLLHKACRAGATTSLAYAAEELGKSLLLIAPTNAILDKTLNAACKELPVKIAANSFCLRWEEAVKEDPFLLNLPLPIDDCENCDHYGICDVTAIIRSKREEGKGITYGVTYDKLSAIMLAKRSKTAEAIKERLRGLDATVWDESHLMGLWQPPAVPIFTCPDVPEEYRVLRNIVDRFQKLCHESNGAISEIFDAAKKGHIGRHLSRWRSIRDPLPFEILAAGYGELIQLAGRRKELNYPEEDILFLKDMASILAGVGMRMSYIREDGVGKVLVIGNEATRQHALREFIRAKERTIKIFTSGTLLEPWKEFFEDFAGEYLEDKIFPEAKYATYRMLIIPDKWSLNSRNFQKKFDEIIGRIEEICLSKAPNRCLVIAPTQKKAAAIAMKLDLPAEIMPTVDYYRSDRTMGVESDLRTCIAVGLAHVPTNAFDYLARGKNPEERAVHSAAIRIQGVHAASWQAWCRVKDPSAQEESTVYCIGTRAKQALDVATWGPGRRMELVRTEVKKSGVSKAAGEEIKSFTFKVDVDYCLDMPRIQAEPRADKRSGRLKVDDMIMGVVSPQRAMKELSEGRDNQNILRACERILDTDYSLGYLPRKSANRLILYIRHFAGKVGKLPNAFKTLLNGNDEELDLMAAFMALYFCHRTNHYAIQRYSDLKKKWEFRKVEKSLDEYNLETIKKHLRADQVDSDRRFTIGVYEIEPGSDTVSWINYDFDRHDQSDPDPKPEILKFSIFLTENKIPFLIEASGSPDSYHLWIFLTPTKTFNAFCVARMLARAAGVKCKEIWPKQEGYAEKTEYGNLVKLPLAYHNGAKTRSCFLDPETLEPLEHIPFPGLVQLFEQPRPGSAPKQPNKARVNALVPTTPTGPSDFRPCLMDVVVTGQCLEKGPGHSLRVAAVVEATHAKLTEDQAVALFQNAPDFNEAITRQYVKGIYAKEYKRAKCSSLLRWGGEIMRSHCQKCHKRWAAENVAKFEQGTLI